MKELVSVEFNEDGIPIIKDAAAYMQCRLVETFEVADHVLMIGEVEAGMDGSGDVLEYRKCDYFK